ncbi:MAG: hypothetical protein QW057_00230 [Candidatus Bathyarchaeia archaeon]
MPKAYSSASFSERAKSTSNYWAVNYAFLVREDRRVLLGVFPSELR